MTRVDQILRLSPKEAAKNFPVRLRCVVVYSDPKWSLLFAADESGCIYVDTKEKWFGSQLDPILIEGVTDNGKFCPIVTSINIAQSLPVAMPAPLQRTLDQLWGGAEDSQWVEVTGEVVSVFDYDRHGAMLLRQKGKQIRVVFRNTPASDLMKFDGAEVRLSGICAVIPDGQRRVTGTVLFVPGLEYLVQEKSPPKKPFSQPLIPIGDLFKPGLFTPDMQLHIRGVVTNRVSANNFSLADDTGVITVQAIDSQELTNTMFLDACGYLALGSQTTKMERVVYRRLGFGMPPRVNQNNERPALNGKLMRPLSEVSLVREMSPDLADLGFPVAIRGVITYFDPELSDCFVQDASGGIWVDNYDQQLDLETGQYVELSGYTSYGYSPYVFKPHFEILGRSQMPEAAQTDIASLFAGKAECRWIAVSGAVQAIKKEENRMGLLLFTENKILIDVWVPGFQKKTTPEGLLDSVVRVHGVATSKFNANKQLTGIQILTPSLDYIDIVEKAPTNLTAIPFKAVQEIMRFSPSAKPFSRVRTRGVVTALRPEQLYIQDGTNAMEVDLRRPARVQIGDLVDVAGFPIVQGLNLRLENSLCEKMGQGTLPFPPAPSVDQILSGQFDAQFIRLSASLLSVEQRKDEQVLSCQLGGAIFEARCQNLAQSPLSKLAKGTLVQLTGVCVIQADEWQRPQTFHIQLAGPGAVVALAAPPLWTRETALKWVQGFALLSFTAFAWVWLLKRKVRQQTDLVRQKLEKESALEERYRELVENANDLIFTQDLEGNFTSINRATESTIGYSPEEALRLNFTQILSPTPAEPRLAKFRERLLTTESSYDEVEVRCKNGTLKRLEVNSRLICQNGKPIGVQGIARDITERHQFEARLRQLSRAMEQSPAAVIITDTVGRIEYVNSKFERLTDEGMEEIQARKALIFESWNISSSAFKTIWQSVLAGNEWRGEMQSRKKNGELFWVFVSLSCIKDSNGVITHIVTVEEDITERRSLESQLRQAQKMESIGQLAAGVAHDFNNILTVILSHTSLMLDAYPKSTDDVESLTEINTAAQRAADLTRQLLAFSRKQIMQLKSMDLNQTIDTMAKMLRRVLGENITLECALTSERSVVKADSGMIEQVIMNLAVNSKDAMPCGGKLIIETRILRLGANEARYNPEAKEGTHVCLVVRDTGTGMNETTKRNIFEPFFTTKEVGKGTGLGLATVYGIVKQHQGWIEVRSEPGMGATFNIYLPQDPTQTTNVQASSQKEECLTRP